MRYLATVFEDSDTNVDDRLLAAAALRKSDDVKLAPITERSVPAPAAPAEPSTPLHQLVKERREREERLRRERLEREALNDADGAILIEAALVAGDNSGNN